MKKNHLPRVPEQPKALPTMQSLLNLNSINVFTLSKNNQEHWTEIRDAFSIGVYFKGCPCYWNVCLIYFFFLFNPFQWQIYSTLLYELCQFSLWIVKLILENQKEISHFNRTKKWKLQFFSVFLLVVLFFGGFPGAGAWGLFVLVFNCET